MTLSKHIADFLRYQMEVKSRSKQTRKCYRVRLLDFQRFVLASYDVIDLAKVDKQHIIDYKAQLEGEGNAKNTIKAYLRTISTFYKWMARDGRVDDSPYPSDLVFRPTEVKPHVIPTPEQIFKIRYRRNTAVAWAAAFETLLSTGMRAGELRQLRAEDINWQDRPIEVTTGIESTYFQGSIILDPNVGVLKGKRLRKVYLSFLAAKMLRRYMESAKIPLKSPLPLFPFTPQAIEYWFEMMGMGIITESSEQRASSNRKPSYGDVDTSKYAGVDKKLLKKIMQRQKKEEQQNPLDKKADIRKKRWRRTKLHPHALRHTFTCVQYYCNYFDERQNVTRLMQLLGHSAMTTTLSYLLRLDLIHDQRTWEKLWTGKASDWMITG